MALEIPGRVYESMRVFMDRKQTGSITLHFSSGKIRTMHVNDVALAEEFEKAIETMRAFFQRKTHGSITLNVIPGEVRTVHINNVIRIEDEEKKAEQSKANGQMR